MSGPWKRGTRWLLIAMLAHAAVGTFFWHWTEDLFRSDRLPFVKAQIAMGFAGFPIDVVRQYVDRALPIQEPLALSKELFDEMFLRQRLSEGLYPRMLDQKSKYRLFVDGRSTRIEGPPYQRLALASPPTESQELDLGILLAGWASLAGIGFAAIAVWRRLLPRVVPVRGPFAVELGVAWLAGGIVAGLAATACTMLQIAWPWRAASLAGLVALAARAVTLKRLGRIKARPELIAMATAFGLLAWRGAQLSTLTWDGRSNWFFLAKRIFIHGMLPMSEMVREEYLWSHPDYPLFFPAYVAQSIGFSALYNERIAVLSIVPLFAAALGLTWFALDRLLGRWPAATLAGVFFFAFETMTIGGNLDGLLVLLLVGEMCAFLLARRGAGWIPLAWFLAAAAAQLKSEGLLFALIVAASAAVTRPGLRRWLRGHWVFPLAILAPAVAAKLWIRALGLDSWFISRQTEVASLFLQRLADLPGELSVVLFSPRFTRIEIILWQCIAALAVFGALWLIGRKASREALACIVAAVGILIPSVVGTLLVFNHTVAYLADHTLNRLFLHSASLLILGAWIWLDA